MCTGYTRHLERIVRTTVLPTPAPADTGVALPSSSPPPPESKRLNLKCDKLL